MLTQSSASSHARPRVLGQLLLASGTITNAQLDAALREQQKTRERLGDVLVRRGVDRNAITRALAEQLRLPFLEPPITSEPDALKIVSAAVARRLHVIPLRLDERNLHVAMADPLDVRAMDDLRFQCARHVQPAVASPQVVEQAIARAYGVSADAAPIIALLEQTLRDASDCGASDVHLEPHHDALRVRVRVDGVLRELARFPDTQAAALISRLKVMSGLDIAVKRRPQDGRAVLSINGRDMGFRVSTLPCFGGEKAVLRLIDTETPLRALDSLEMPEPVLSGFAKSLRRGHGVLLVTGPTGSGKTTTLYAALAALDRDRVNVTTLEDPIEHRLDGLTQVQVHSKAGLGFAAALRAVLRQDPDVIMVGEMRDRETAETAMAAAMTGHLVLSTLHTNDAPGAVTRLLDMGVAPYLIVGSLAGVLAQRLVRRVCTSCRIADLTSTDERALGLPETCVRARGCDRCAEGYRGRIPVFEWLPVTSELRAALGRKAGAGSLMANGRGSLREAAIRVVSEGISTPEEVIPLLLSSDSGRLGPSQT